MQNPEEVKIQRLMSVIRGKALVKRQHDVEGTKQIFVGEERITDEELLEAWELIERKLLVCTPSEFNSGWHIVRYELPNSLLNATSSVIS